MIQRIQSIYFLIAAVFISLTYFVTIASFGDGDALYQLFVCHVVGPDAANFTMSVVPMAGLPLLSSVLSFVAIFLFKKRLLQIKLGQVALFFSFLLIAAEGFYFWKMLNLVALDAHVGTGIILQIVAIISLFMAINSVKKDEALVRSADRIR